MSAAQEIAEIRNELRELRTGFQRLEAELAALAKQPSRTPRWTPQEAAEMRVLMSGWMADLDAPGMETYDVYAYLFDEPANV